MKSSPLSTYSHLWARLALALATPQIWCLLASPRGDPPLRWPTVLCMFTEAAGLGSGYVLGSQAPHPNLVFSIPPQSRAGAWRGWEGGGVRTALHADPSVRGFWVPRPAPPAHYFLSGLLLLGTLSIQKVMAQV